MSDGFDEDGNSYLPPYKPSRQQVEPPTSKHDEAIMGIVDLVDYDSPKVKNFAIIPARAIMDKVFAAGYAQCKVDAERAINQVNKKWVEYDVDDPHGYVDDVFKDTHTAIRALEPKV